MSTLAAVELVGGPACGMQAAMELLPPGQTYLVEIVREGDITGIRDVWAYRFANRSTPDGCWVLECERYVGFRGMPVESPEQGGAA